MPLPAKRCAGRSPAVQWEIKPKQNLEVAAAAELCSVAKLLRHGIEELLVDDDHDRNDWLWQEDAAPGIDQGW